MKTKEKSRSLLEQEAGQAETAACDGATTSAFKFNTEGVARQCKVVNLLGQGAENAIPLRQLTAITGMKGRAIRKEIEIERRRGVPILSDNVNGYFLPADDGEKEQFIKSMQHRALEIMRTARAIKGDVSKL